MGYVYSRVSVQQQVCLTDNTEKKDICADDTRHLVVQLLRFAMVDEKVDAMVM